MTLCVRAAEPGDAPAITALLLEDAKVREALNPGLWAVAPDAKARVQASLATITDPITGPVRHHWTVAEHNGVVVAVTHGINVPPPPIVDLKGGTAGVLLDDCHFAADLSASTALLDATEQVMAEAGAVLFVAASPHDWGERTGFLADAGYETTTLYMAKTGFGDRHEYNSVRPATAVDVEGIVRLSAQHRAQLQIANPRFWNIHAEADARFGSWMHASLAFPDRSIFVSGSSDAVDGFIIAQPGSPLHLPAAHEIAGIGLIDDFYAVAFEPSDGGNSAAESAGGLLSAAEGAFNDKNIETALAICPARMMAKADALRSHGYTTANLWMVKK